MIQIVVEVIPATRLIATIAPAPGQDVQVVHRATDYSDIPICGAQMATIRVIPEGELNRRTKRRLYRLCRNCTRKQAKRDVAANHDSLPTTHVTAAPWGELRVDSMDRASFRKQTERRNGRGGLMAYLKAWGYQLEGSTSNS